ncbi:TPR repeat-containing protein YrrB [mine drainage metagenome]|uniref:TPR repeat-containing protein YrrB n=1 Tax=mine drainage metagenome TaxID=410659 RepID=A0A1J5QUH8_9ZZZZ
MKQRRHLPPQRHSAAMGFRPSGAAAPLNDAKLKLALALHQQGQLNQAEALYKEILLSQPLHFDALQLLATIAGQRRNSALAVELFEQALRIRPDHAESLSNRGNALLDLERHDEALSSYDRALAIRPDYAEAHNNRGNALRALGRPDEALSSYGRALAIRPDYAEAHSNRGNALLDLDRPGDALASYDRALGIRPDYAEACYNRGNALRELQRPAEALANYDRALASRPEYAEAHSNRGNALLDLKRPGEALASYDRALGIRADFAQALNNRGNALMALNRLDEAVASFDRALAIRPDYAEAHSNRGNALRDLMRLDEALSSYGLALGIRPDYAEVHWNESFCRLLMGDYALGWQKYEWRWDRALKVDSLRSFPQPLWLGEENLEHKTILLHAEQGFGDTLQFCRYAPLVAARGARVVLDVPAALKSLCQTLAGVDTVLATGDALPFFDFHVPLMSLPLALGTRLDSIPAGLPYLHAAPELGAAWNAWLGRREKPRIGLAWSGRPIHKNDHNRSLPFALLADLIDDGAEFICLQKEFRAEEEETVRRHPCLRNVSERLQDFSDTAALIETLDLVITVDTSIAHLAGALGKPVWILLPFSPDFRWLLGREDSPWYPSARIFRQQQPGRWEPVLADVRQALADRHAGGDGLQPALGRQP